MEWLIRPEIDYSLEEEFQQDIENRLEQVYGRSSRFQKFDKLGMGGIASYVLHNTINAQRISNYVEEKMQVQVQVEEFLQDAVLIALNDSHPLKQQYSFREN